jgi:iron uptake system component EfeO
MKQRIFLVLAVMGLVVAGCASDDGGNVTGSASGSGSGSVSGSGSAVSEANSSDKGADNALIKAGVAEYQTWVRQQTAEIRDQAKVFTDAVRAGDVEAAKAAYAPSRVGWEGIEPVASLVPEIDGVVDARVDDFADEDDPDWTGWHKLEHSLWVKGTITDADKELADRLDADLETLQTKVATLTIKPAVVAVGASELIEEVSGGKITGEEDRYSHTDLWDFAANVEGSKQAYQALKPALVKADKDEAADIDALFAKLDDQLATYRDGTGYKAYDALTDADKDKMKATLGQLSEELADMAGTLGLS